MTTSQATLARIESLKAYAATRTPEQKKSDMPTAMRLQIARRAARAA